MLFGEHAVVYDHPCIVTAIDQRLRLTVEVSDRFILDASVLDIQGKGLGFDIAAAIYGRILYFWTGGKKIEELKIGELPLIIGYTGIKADTVTLINKVKELEDTNPENIKRIYGEIESIVEQ